MRSRAQTFILFIYFLKVLCLSDVYVQCGAQTYIKIKSHTLNQLSQPVVPRAQSFSKIYLQIIKSLS